LSHMTPISRQSRGFTLVELLVALTIMGIIAGLLGSSLRFSIGTADKVESRIAAIESLHQSQRAFRRQVQLALPILQPDDDAGQTLDFAAGATAFEFVAPLPGLDTGGMLYRISLHIEDDDRMEGQQGRVIMAYRLYLDGSQGHGRIEEAREVVLMDGFSRASFSYRDTLRPRDGRWMEAWPHGDRLPDLVRLTLFPDSGDERDEMNLIVAIKATLPTRGGVS